MIGTVQEFKLETYSMRHHLVQGCITRSTRAACGLSGGSVRLARVSLHFQKKIYIYILTGLSSLGNAANLVEKLYENYLLNILCNFLIDFTHHLINDLEKYGISVDFKFLPKERYTNFTDTGPNMCENPLFFF
jgi:hypothetical protein